MGGSKRNLNVNISKILSKPKTTKNLGFQILFEDLRTTINEDLIKKISERILTIL